MGRLSVIKGLLTITLLGHCLVTLGQQTSSASQTLTNLPAGAIIEIPLTLTKEMDLNFGAAISGSSAGTLTLAASGTATRTVTGGVRLLSDGYVNAARFTVSGDADRSFSISLPSSVTIAGPSGASMSLTNFTENSGNVLNGGTNSFYVGATLNMNARQRGGSYSGTFSVSVDYY